MMKREKKFTDITYSNGLNMSKIHPDKHPRFSRNLYFWLAHRKRDGFREKCQVWHNVENNTYYIGYEYDGSIIGRCLHTILCKIGYTNTLYSYTLNKLDVVLVENFWEQYESKGKCFIDPEHELYWYENNRWCTHGDIRKCMWCNNYTQRLIVEPVTVYKRTWVRNDKKNL